MAERLLNYQTKIENYRDPVKPLVNSLTKEANELLNPYGSNIAEFICDQIVYSSPSRRIALFYLVDSIIKNVKPYGRVFEDRLRKVFIRCFQEATEPKHRETFKKLHRLWKGFLSEVVLRDLQSFIDSYVPAVSHAPPQVQPSHSHTYHDEPPAKRARVDPYAAPVAAPAPALVYGYDSAQQAPSYDQQSSYTAPVGVDTGLDAEGLAGALDLDVLGRVVGGRDGFQATTAEPEGAHAEAVAAARAIVRADDGAVDLSWHWLRHPRVSGVLAITSDLPTQCRTCGLRLPDPALMPGHLNIHYWLNSRAGLGGKPPSRRWFLDAPAWAAQRAMLGEDAEEEEEEVKGAEPGPSIVVDPSKLPGRCFLCAEAFSAPDFDQDRDEWLLHDTVIFTTAQLLEDARTHLEAAGDRFEAAAVLRDLSVDVTGRDGSAVHHRCYATQLLGQAGVEGRGQ